MLIDDRTPPSEPGKRPVWEPNWKMWGWIAATVGLMVGASVAAGLFSVLLTFAAMACTAQAVVTALPDDAANGLREYRQ